MVECHVDSCSDFQERMNKETLFGGNLSVNKEENERQLLIFGHDEANIQAIFTYQEELVWTEWKNSISTKR